MVYYELRKAESPEFTAVKRLTDDCLGLRDSTWVWQLGQAEAPAKACHGYIQRLAARYTSQEAALSEQIGIKKSRGESYMGDIIYVAAASQKTLDRAAILLAGVNDGVNRAMKPAMARASTRLKKAGH